MSEQQLLALEIPNSTRHAMGMFRLIGIVVVVWWVAQALGFSGSPSHLHMPGGEVIHSGGGVLAGFAGLVIVALIAMFFGLFKLLIVLPFLLIMMLVGVVLLPILLPLALVGVFLMLIVSVFMGMASMLFA